MLSTSVSKFSRAVLWVDIEYFLTRCSYVRSKVSWYQYLWFVDIFKACKLIDFPQFFSDWIASSLPVLTLYTKKKPTTTQNKNTIHNMLGWFKKPYSRADHLSGVHTFATVINLVWVRNIKHIEIKKTSRSL